MFFHFEQNAKKALPVGFPWCWFVFVGFDWVCPTVRLLRMFRAYHSSLPKWALFWTWLHAARQNSHHVCFENVRIRAQTVQRGVTFQKRRSRRQSRMHAFTSASRRTVRHTQSKPTKTNQQQGNPTGKACFAFCSKWKIIQIKMHSQSNSEKLSLEHSKNCANA